MTTTSLLQVTEDSFATDVEQAPQLTMVDFVAAWCPHCRSMAPLVERMAVEYAGRLRVGIVDVDANPRLAERFGVRGLPTVIFFHDGNPVHRIVGAVPRQRLEAVINDLLAPVGAVP